MYKPFLIVTLVAARRKGDPALTTQSEFANQVGKHWVYRFSGYPENSDSILHVITFQ